MVITNILLGTCAYSLKILTITMNSVCGIVLIALRRTYLLLPLENPRTNYFHLGTIVASFGFCLKLKEKSFIYFFSAWYFTDCSIWNARRRFQRSLLWQSVIGLAVRTLLRQITSVCVRGYVVSTIGSTNTHSTMLVYWWY